MGNKIRVECFHVILSVKISRGQGEYLVFKVNQFEKTLKLGGYLETYREIGKIGGVTYKIVEFLQKLDDYKKILGMVVLNCFKNYLNFI